VQRFRAWLNQLLALNGSARGIATGFAVGFGLSLLPIPFLGMFTALALIPSLRLSPVATYLGTAIINPVTGPFFYFVDLWLGMRLWGLQAPSWEELRVLDGAGWWRLFSELVGPFLTGGTVLMPIGGGLSFVVVYYAVLRWRARSGSVSPAHARKSGREKALSSAANERRSAGATDPKR
jgi:uncharacterized protein (DUF2062 family)